MTHRSVKSSHHLHEDASLAQMLGIHAGLFHVSGTCCMTSLITDSQ